MTPSNIMVGFKITGVYPVNQYAIPLVRKIRCHFVRAQVLILSHSTHRHDLEGFYCHLMLIMIIHQLSVLYLKIMITICLLCRNQMVIHIYSQLRKKLSSESDLKKDMI